MAGIISAVWAGAVVTSGYIAKALSILNVKYYVSQQLAQMQAHSLNNCLLYTSPSPRDS